MNRLEKLERTRKSLCRDAAPRVARLAMESRAFLDTLCNGTPKLDREIGRGQYGVVYACHRWGKYGGSKQETTCRKISHSTGRKALVRSSCRVLPHAMFTGQ